MQWRCVRYSSVCRDDRATGSNTDLDCRRNDRPAARLHGTEWDGADGVAGESVFRSCVLVSWAARESCDIVHPPSEAWQLERFIFLRNHKVQGPSCDYISHAYLHWLRCKRCDGHLPWGRGHELCRRQYASADEAQD